MTNALFKNIKIDKNTRSGIEEDNAQKIKRANGHITARAAPSWFSRSVFFLRKARVTRFRECLYRSRDSKFL